MTRKEVEDHAGVINALLNFESLCMDDLLSHDTAQRQVIEDYRNTIIEVGIKLGLIMPERERFFKEDAVKVIKQQAQEIGRLREALKAVLDCIVRTAPDDLPQRDWLGYGCWMYAGDALAQIDAEVLEQARAALQPAQASRPERSEG